MKCCEVPHVTCQSNTTGELTFSLDIVFTNLECIQAVLLSLPDGVGENISSCTVDVGTSSIYKSETCCCGTVQQKH